MIARKEFKRLYQAELLPSSASNYSVGDIWDRIGINNLLVPENDNIGYICGDDALSKDLEKIKKVKANFPDIDLTSDINADIAVDIPSFNVSLASALKVKKVEKMVIRGVSAKNSLSGFRTRIVDSLEALKRSNINKYRKYIKTKEMVTALFYAETVEIQITKTVTNQTEFKLAIQQAFNVNAKVNFDSKNKVSIILSNPNCPFAAQFEPGRDI